MTKSSAVKEQDPLARLWIHEVSRVFSDRLINDEDRDWFYALIIELLGRHFNTRWEIEEIFIKNKILFGVKTKSLPQIQPQPTFSLHNLISNFP